LRRAPVESYVKFLFALIGLIGEVYTGIHKAYIPLTDKASSVTSMAMPHEHDHEHEHQHARRNAVAQPQMIETWTMEHANLQHVTMYSAFIIGSVVEILLYHRVELPPRIEYFLGALAFAGEGFLFANHLHSRDLIDIQVHTYLLNAIYGCVIFALLETFRPNEIIFTYGRAMCTLLQGTWFWEIGFVLYPPTDSPRFKWDLNDHGQLMVVTATFMWHVFFIIIGLLIQIGVMKWLYRSSKRIAYAWDELIEIDEELNRVHVNLDQNDVETKFLRINSEDEESLDENVEFDTRKLLKSSKKELIKMDNINEASITSSTSGVDSKNSYSN